VDSVIIPYKERHLILIRKKKELDDLNPSALTGERMKPYYIDEASKLQCMKTVRKAKKKKPKCLSLESS
jgi:hypothetical protein